MTATFTETATGTPTATPACGDGIVQPGEQCDDGNRINCDGCDNNCTFTAMGNGIVCPPEQCDDGNLVNGDCCSSTGQFEPAGSPCPDDGNGCTNDVCNATGMCTHPNNTAPCDDGVFCNGTDTCSSGSCSAHAGNPCTTECNRTCNETTDSCFNPATTPCDDGDACTLHDACDGTGTCVGNTTTGNYTVLAGTGRAVLGRATSSEAQQTAVMGDVCAFDIDLQAFSTVQGGRGRAPLDADSTSQLPGNLLPEGEQSRWGLRHRWRMGEATGERHRGRAVRH